MTLKPLFLIAAIALTAPPVQAGFKCSSPLLDAGVRGLEKIFEPPYDVALTHIGGAIVEANMSKKLTKDGITKLTVAAPRLAAEKKLTAANAKFLKDTLNDRAQDSVPGWVSTVLGAFAPVAWVGISADVAIQLINGKGDAGRLSLANVAGTVGVGGTVSVHERVASDAKGVRKYIWMYSHTAKLNDVPITTLLGVCSADVVEG